MSRKQFLEQKGYKPVEISNRLVIFKKIFTIVYIVKEEEKEYIGQRDLEKEYAMM
jgi:hypothetical protein